MIGILQQLLHDFDTALRVTGVHYASVVDKPQPKQSVQFGGHAFTSKKKRQYVNDVIEDLRGSLKGEQLEGHVRVTVLFCFPWRKSDSKLVKFIWALMGKRPDIDNLLKPLLDGLGKVCLKDDSAIVEIKARKIRFAFPCIALKLETVEVAR